MLAKYVQFPGSPPLTRGVQNYIDISITPQRITPAYAGSTAASGFQHRSSQDHPRLRGEYYYLMISQIESSESPPLTRGVLIDMLEFSIYGGITPAYAGSTGGGCMVLYGTIGSPPLTRGVPKAKALHPRGKRITPAYAGSTYSQPSRRCPCEDHPRLRGEYDCQ